MSTMVAADDETRSGVREDLECFADLYEVPRPRGRHRWYQPEARDRGLDSKNAVAHGISVTAGTITSAAAIMVVVFSVFVTMKFTMIQQLGLGLAVAVFVDATVIRSILLPAIMRLLGDWNWYLPSFLGWLPRVTIESEVFEPVPDSHQSAERSPGWHLPVPSHSPEGSLET